MALFASISLVFYALCLSFCIQSAASQTFQYSRGWTNGKRSGTASIPQLKATNQMTSIDDIPDMCNKILLAEILMLGKPLCLYATHSSNYFQRPQINHELELMSPLSSTRLINVAAAGAPIEPSLPFNSNDRYKRHDD